MHEIEGAAKFIRRRPATGPSVLWHLGPWGRKPRRAVRSVHRARTDARRVVVSVAITWSTAALALSACRERERERSRHRPAVASATASAAAPERSQAPPAERPPSLPPLDDSPPATLEAQRKRLLGRFQAELKVSEEALERVRAIFAASDWLGQGNPRIAEYSMTRAECRKARAGVRLAEADAVCRAPNMVALYDPKLGQGPNDAKVCIDQYEFPNLPCEYPVVWVRSSEAGDLCKALGKRLCDAHEWEGACAGRLLAAEQEYGWETLPKIYDDKGLRKERRLLMEHNHNEHREVLWAYGAEKNHAKCATGARKDPRCTVVDWGICGTNSYPAGSFPECVSAFGAYDLHGNVAEHMSLPLYPDELGVRGGVGWTEMKGSWFLFGREETHPDDCRWRARNWHTTRVDHWNSHRNYHLGFRCCRDVKR